MKRKYRNQNIRKRKTNHGIYGINANVSSVPRKVKNQSDISSKVKAVIID